MDKDIITITTSDGSKKDMEVVLTFLDEKTKINYILYKELDNEEECYAAKYVKEDDSFKIDSNLTEGELKILEYLLNKSLEVKNEN